MKKEVFLLGVFCTLIVGHSYAQQIKGKVIDATTSESLPFTNVVIVNDHSSDAFKGTVTDMDGNFVLPSNNDRERVRISYLGYTTKDTIISKANFNTISLSQDATVLNEVVVKGTRNTVKMENGGIAMDVANSPLKNIGTANDVLEKLPFVVKNGDGITVLGKGTPLIYINNRLVRNDNELERLNSANIKKVTVITNPGPEYDATVSAVIRIEAVRPPGEGLGGELYGRVDVRSKVSADGSVDLNYRKNKLDVFAYYGYSDTRRKVLSNMDQSMETNGKTTDVYSVPHEDHKDINHQVDAGFNYEFNERHSAGAKYTYTNNPFSELDLYMPTQVYTNDEFVERFDTKTLMATLDSKSHLLNIYYTGKVADWLKVQFDFDYTKGNNDNNNNALSVREASERVNTTSLQNYDLYAGKLQLGTPLWGNELNYGIEFSHTSNEQNYIVNDNEGAEELVSNSNTAKQKLFAAFANVSRSVNKWNFNAGLRLENVGFDYFENKIKVEEQSRIYTNLFPSASINYRDEKVQMMLGYRSTIQRPGYYQLRNSIQFDSPYTYETGNPYLKSTRMDDISYLFLWRKLRFMASYKFYENYITSLPGRYKDTDIVLLGPENLRPMQILTVSANYSPKFGFWEPVAGIGISKDYLGDADKRGKDCEKPIWNYSLQNTFRLPAGWVFMADIQGTSSGNSRMTYMYGQYRVNVRLTKTFMNDRLVLNLRGADILGTYRHEFLMEAYPAATYLKKNLDTRSWQLSVRYKFNSTRSKYKGQSASEEERNRL